MEITVNAITSDRHVQAYCTCYHAERTHAGTRCRVDGCACGGFSLGSLRDERGHKHTAECPCWRCPDLWAELLAEYEKLRDIEAERATPSESFREACRPSTALMAFAPVIGEQRRQAERQRFALPTPTYPLRRGPGADGVLTRGQR